MWKHTRSISKTDTQITEVRSQGDYHKGIDADSRFWVRGWVQMISGDLDMKVWIRTSDQASGYWMCEGKQIWADSGLKSGGMDKGMEVRMHVQKGSGWIEDWRSGGLDRGYRDPDVCPEGVGISWDIAACKKHEYEHVKSVETRGVQDPKGQLLTDRIDMDKGAEAGAVLQYLKW
ncbi:hypothetical protein DFJ58DRAFT_848378 [Suillus subalutaceus]|uniref:uncharacterized protein n=1 Tax=Suillus subalutaceus TaxID=48586 RepID=UPI001B8666FC|nr:uncharacterized protein DFJ58DRAFT_848378 [Suillus subalutaceus]KAG1830724.1 hypothetical protein DFJ58DRAFT_848378 [Suillus subalutaceus]